ncbi:hypothetical protein EJ04DRAFT_157565 [Polyplosphaeria fusca]|uniref:Uncharacterized protein n=1 Tax=Polyplosphaeria fusca TaxID=682080 RepID=A0A9P4QZM5_9PLEO|nr:hypothetical protein EJ04DRAFT_157565 [Polyplosphaeria fusca]
MRVLRQQEACVTAHGMWDVALVLLFVQPSPPRIQCNHEPEAATTRTLATRPSSTMQYTVFRRARETRRPPRAVLSTPARGHGPDCASGNPLHGAPVSTQPKPLAPHCDLVLWSLIGTLNSCQVLVNPWFGSFENTFISPAPPEHDVNEAASAQMFKSKAGTRHKEQL